MTVSAVSPTSWTRATGRWQWRHEMSSRLPAMLAIAVPRHQRRYTEMFAPVLRTLVPWGRPVGPHVHSECWPTGGSRLGKRTPPQLPRSCCKRRRGSRSLTPTDSWAGDGQVFSTPPRGRVDRIPELLGEIERLAEPTNGLP